MLLKEKIAEDIKNSMRQKAELKLSVLRMLSSAIKNKELEKRGKTGKEEVLTEGEVVAAIRSEAKKRKDSISEFEKAGRKELAEKEAAEMKILEAYLPAEISDEDLAGMVRETIASMGEVSIKDFGKIIGAVMKRAGGQASGDRVSQVVKLLLSQSDK